MFDVLGAPRALTATTRRSAIVLSVVSASWMLGACASGGMSVSSLDAPLATPASQKETASTGSPQQSELVKATEYWGKAHAGNPKDAVAALNYARNLKALGSKKEALVILQEAHNSNPTNRQINSEYGRLALEHDQISTAQKLLEQADDATNPDWKTISARGTVMAKQGKHLEAIAHFERALRIVPNQASVLNNLAMSHAMEGRAQKAEQLLRQAASLNKSDARVADNLSLVVQLQGKKPTDDGAAPANVEPNGEAEKVAAAPVAESAPVSKAAALPTASTTKSTGKAKGKSAAAEPVVDAAEMVRRLADADAGAASKPTR